MSIADTKFKHGDFTGLAANYSKFRPSYSEKVRDEILSYCGRKIDDIDFVDVGAGTGIWTRMLAEKGTRTAIAVEPNEDMRVHGTKDSAHTNIEWYDGCGENTSLPDNSANLVTMASSFHWVDFDSGCKEFYRILKPRGCFVALWNPRYLANNPLLEEIEMELQRRVPELKRVSSGLSGITSILSEKILRSGLFNELQYIEDIHSKRISTEQYLGAWWSVNDVRVQAGEGRFKSFMDFVEDKIGHLDSIEVSYKTRAWMVRKA